MFGYQSLLFAFNLVLSTAISSFAVVAIAQESKNGNSKQLVTRQVCKFDASMMYLRNGTLTFDGKDLIAVEPHKKISLYNVETLQEKVVIASPLVVNAWSDSAMGGVFVTMLSERQVSQENGIRAQQLFKLLHFTNVADLVAWNPKWSKEAIGRDVQIQWICGSKLFFMRPFGVQEASCLLLDLNGVEVGAFKSPGTIYAGLDTSDEGIEVYFQTKAPPFGFVMRGILDSKYQKVTRVENFLPSQFSNKILTPMDMRTIRLRGLKPGDVRRFIEWTNGPLYASNQHAEYKGLEPDHLVSVFRSDLGWPRWFERGVLSAAESADEYTIVKSVLKFPENNVNLHFPPFLFRRSGDLILLPSGLDNEQTFVQDAVLTDNKLVVSIANYSTGIKGQRVTTLSLCTLVDSP